MTSLDSIAVLLGVAGPWEQKGGAYWLNPADRSVRDVAQAMNTCGARFITITAYQLPADTGMRLEYHWDLAGKVLGFSFEIKSRAIESIFDLCEAADWIEREVHEEYAIDFTGREYEPLLLRAGATPGVNQREEGK
jgi:NADH:ubiquinone oxidoreductase subunit C